MARPETKRKPPRFPYVAALLCAACVGAAVWTWMRYSYCSDVTAGHLFKMATAVAAEHRWPDRSYVRFRTAIARVLTVESQDDGHLFWVQPERMPTARLWLKLPRGSEAEVQATEERVFRGRFYAERYYVSPGLPSPANLLIRPVYVDTTASRFHPASIAGLAVGAMGVFVFSVALRHWLGERRAVMEPEAS